MTEPSTTESLPDIRTDTLLGDLRDAILQRLRALPKPWTVLSEREQADWIAGVEVVAQHLVHQTVLVVAAQGRPSVPGTIEKITIKDGCKIELSTTRAMGAVEFLNGHLGQAVTIVHLSLIHI